MTAHLELYVSALALAIVLILPLGLELGTDVQELAVAAIAACVLQGMVHWLVRRRVRAVRQALISEVRGLLRDRINNHLQVVLFSLAGAAARSDTLEDRQHLAEAMTAMAAVSSTLDELSTDSLRQWKDRYGPALIGVANLGGTGADSERDGSAAGR
ncbi:MAG: hypothetical protein ABIQ49_16015 [Gemmatimonadales bacterium]